MTQMTHALSYPQVQCFLLNVTGEHFLSYHFCKLSVTYCQQALDIHKISAVICDPGLKQH